MQSGVGGGDMGCGSGLPRQQTTNWLRYPQHSLFQPWNISVAILITVWFISTALLMLQLPFNWWLEIIFGDHLGFIWTRTGQFFFLLLKSFIKGRIHIAATGVQVSKVCQAVYVGCETCSRPLEQVSENIDYNLWVWRLIWFCYTGRMRMVCIASVPPAWSKNQEVSVASTLHSLISSWNTANSHGHRDNGSLQRIPINWSLQFQWVLTAITV